MTIQNARRSGLMVALSLGGLMAVTTAFRPAAPAVPASHRTAHHDSTILRVQNDGFTDRVVYAVTGGGMQQRLGTAGAVSTTTFRIPRMFVNTASSVYFAARKFAGFYWEWSPQAIIQRGDTVSVMIQPGVGALQLTSIRSD